MATAASDTTPAQATPPLSVTRLKQIATDVCDSALADAKRYNPAIVDEWNSKIVNSFLKALVSETSTPTTTEPTNTASTTNDQAPPKFKFAVNSTIIQHPLSRTSTTGTSTTNADADPSNSESTPTDSVVEKSVPLKRGMHSASGAYWNNAKDGMWTHKYEGVDAKGMDVVLLVMWIGI